VDADRDPFLDRIAAELRSKRVDPSVDARIMAAVRETGPARWPRLLMPRRLTVTPLPWSLAAAAALLFAAFFGAGVAKRSAFFSGFFSAFTATAHDSSRHVQFTLIAPDAKKVVVVGDFNAWDQTHAGYQAKQSGGVWTVTAPVPNGHHRYSFVVDDSLWVADPMAPRANDNDFGLPKSALVVGQEQ
jgi:predicted carbohydrate-binding protein with CBM48